MMVYGKMTRDSHALLSPLLQRHTIPEDAISVVYLSAEWTSPVDVVILPYIKKNLTLNERLVVVHHGDFTNTEDANVSYISCNSSEFVDVCRSLGIKRLPMTLIINEPSPPTPHSVLRLLVEAMHQSSNVRDWGIDIESVYRPLDTDTPALVQLREEANMLFEQGNFVGGAKGFVRALLHCPTCPKANFNLSVILQMMNEMYFAVDHMLRVVAENDQDAVAHTVLRTVLYPAEPNLVIEGYETIVVDHQDHYRAAHSLATIRGEATTAAPAYVRQVFDRLAETFEEKLVTHLEYRVPWQIVDALQRANALTTSLEDQPFTVVDLGCGTGLCGRLLRPFASHIAGIDLSPLMIEKTLESGFYDEAQTADIIPYLSSKSDASLDLVVSADVWIYVGALDTIFPLVAQKLRLHRWFAFSTELLSSGDGYKLASSGRFQHSDAYITSLAAQHGFITVVQEEIVVRKESSEPIPGRVFMLQREQ